MEWSHRVPCAIPEAEIRNICTLHNLPELCADVYELTEWEPGSTQGVISCVWGLFQTEVHPIRDGVRYALTSCPNALQWTITSRNGETTLHCSINQTTPDPDFVESVDQFMANFFAGFLACLPELKETECRSI